MKGREEEIASPIAERIVKKIAHLARPRHHGDEEIALWFALLRWERSGSSGTNPGAVGIVLRPSRRLLAVKYERRECDVESCIEGFVKSFVEAYEQANAPRQ